MDRDIGQEILDGIREIKANKSALRIHTLIEPVSPREIWEKLHLSQAAFTGLIGVSIRTLQDWEQGRRNPSGPAKALLRIAMQHPEAFITEQKIWWYNCNRNRTLAGGHPMPQHPKNFTIQIQSADGAICNTGFLLESRTAGPDAAHHLDFSAGSI